MYVYVIISFIYIYLHISINTSFWLCGTLIPLEAKRQGKWQVARILYFTHWYHDVSYLGCVI